MTLDKKTDDAYKTIGEVAIELGLRNSKTGKLQTHTIRYWESQFKQIKPIIGPGQRRYYSNKSFKIVKSIMYLLKEKGLTINGVKKILNNKKNELLDHDVNLSINKPVLKTKNIRKRLKNISKLIKEIKDLK